MDLKINKYLINKTFIKTICTIVVVFKNNSVTIRYDIKVYDCIYLCTVLTTTKWFTVVFELFIRLFNIFENTWNTDHNYEAR